MRRAAALLLICWACDDAAPMVVLPGLVAVSGSAPWNSAACRGPVGRSGVPFANAEVEPYVAVFLGWSGHSRAGRRETPRCTATYLGATRKNGRTNRARRQGASAQSSPLELKTRRNIMLFWPPLPPA